MLWWFAQTSLIAGALAVVATLAGRWKRFGPEARHALWLLVLIKLAIPPIVEWPWSVPDAWAARSGPVAVAAAAVAVADPITAPTPVPLAPVPIAPPLASPEPEPPPLAGLPPSPEEALVDVENRNEAIIPPAPDPGPIEAPREMGESAPVPRTQVLKISDSRSPILVFPSRIWNWTTALLAAWLAGSAGVVARRSIKIFRFHRSLADSRPAPAWLVAEARAIGEPVGVRPPPVLASSRVATPLLWCLGRPRLILPEALIGRLGADRWAGILAHEFAHLARGDHWVVRLELLVEAVWWWNPIFWLTRRKIHELAEIACDARVVRALPGRRHAYAEALVDVCEHISRSANPAPSLGVGGGGAAHSLEGRLLMILRDPIPRRPSRRAAGLAILLAALALPAWTLGQQQQTEPPRPKGDAPATKVDVPPTLSANPPATEAPPQAAPVPARPPGLPTIEAIIAAQAEARKSLGNLSFRYVVTSRDQSRSLVYPPGWGGGMGGGLVGPGGIGGGRAMQPALPTQRLKAVHIQVADVVLGLQQDAPYGSRLDVIEARPATGSAPEPARPLAWDRRFVAYNGEGYLALTMAWDKAGSVPFRWLGANTQVRDWGDSLTATIHNGNRQPSQDQGIEPLNPRPANVLDLASSSLPFLDPNLARAEVVGRDTIDGQEVVRVAWIANADIGVRGLCWFRGPALVRAETTQDPRGPAMGRKSWRKRSSDFVLLGNAWLPRRISYEESQADPASGEPIRSSEREIVIEYSQVAPQNTPEVFRPKLAIQTIDDLSGNFTAIPPEIPAGLVARLAKAVAESKFGPPIVEKTVEEFKAAPPAEPQPVAPAVAPNPANPAATDVVTKVDEAPAGRLMIDVGTAPPAPVAPKADAAGLDAPKADAFDLAFPVNPAKPSAIDKAVLRRFYDDPEVDHLVRLKNQTREKLDALKKIVTSADDPASQVLKRDIDEYQKGIDRYWTAKKAKIRLEIAQTSTETEVLQARRDGKAADLRKAEAQRALAQTVVARNARLKKIGPLNVSAEDSAKADGELAIAEAEVAGKQAALAEADALLNNAKRRIGLAETPTPEPKEADRDLLALEARDEIAVRQARRDGKAAELRKSEARREQAKIVENSTKKLADNNGVSQAEYQKYVIELKFAEEDVTSKQADLAEADAFLNQSKRRLAGRWTAVAGASSSANRPATLAEFRDAVELLEVQIQGKQAELRGTEVKLDAVKTIMDTRKPLAAAGRIAPAYAVESETNFKLAQAELDAKKAELLESETKLKQARRQVEATEARLRRELERVKDRLKWSEDMFKKKFVSQATYASDKAAYDELMIQLDPKYVPAAPADAGAEAPAKPQTMLNDPTKYFTFFLGAFW